jgi:hypothetical protein
MVTVGTKAYAAEGNAAGVGAHDDQVDRLLISTLDPSLWLYGR